MGNIPVTIYSATRRGSGSQRLLAGRLTRIARSCPGDAAPTAYRIKQKKPPPPPPPLPRSVKGSVPKPGPKPRPTIPPSPPLKRYITEDIKLKLSWLSWKPKTCSVPNKPTPPPTIPPKNPYRIAEENKILELHPAGSSFTYLGIDFTVTHHFLGAFIYCDYVDSNGRVIEKDFSVSKMKMIDNIGNLPAS